MIKDIERAMRKNQKSSASKVTPKMAKRASFAIDMRARRHSTLPVIPRHFIPINEEADSSSKDSLTQDSDIDEYTKSQNKEKKEKANSEAKSGETKDSKKKRGPI